MKRIASVLLVTIIFCLSAAAQDIQLQDTLSGAVVTATFRKDVIPAQSLSGEHLKRLSANSVADALRYFSGVQIKDYGGIGGLKTINIRSMGSQHVGVFYDGIQISNAQNGTVDLGKFSMDNMEVLSVHNGQKSGVFQSAKDFASAGSLYMVSRRPQFSSKNDIFNIKARTGSFDLGNISALWDHRYNSHISTSVNAEFLNTSGKYKYRYHKDGGYDTTEVRRNGDVMYFRAEAGVFGKYDRSEWMVKGYFYNSERGYPGAAVKKDDGIALLNEDRQKDRNWFFQGSFTHHATEWFSFMVKGKYANDYMNYIMPPETTLEPADNHYWQQEVYMSASGLFRILPWWTANIACDWQWNALDADGSDMFNANFIHPKRNTVLSAASTSADFPFGLSVQASLLHTFVKDKGDRESAVMNDKSLLTPSVILSYRPWKGIDLTFRAFYKEIFRMPTFNDLYYVNLGNRNLKPEYTDQYDVGIMYRKTFSGFFSGIEVSSDAYYNQVWNKIIATPTSNQLVWTMVNLGYVKILGTDINITPSFRFGEVDLSARLSYTFQRARDFTESKKENEPGVISTYGDQIPYIPVHSGSAVLRCGWRTWNFNYSFIYTGERYMLGGNIPVNYIQPWYTSDVSVSKTIAMKVGELGVTAEINNIFNQQYEVVKWYPMPGTNFKIILSWTF